LGALAAALLALRATPSGAHSVGISRGAYRAEGAQVRAEMLFARTELAMALPQVDADGDGVLSASEVERGQAQLSGWIAQGVAVRSGGVDCEPHVERAVATELDGIEIDAVYRCARPVAAFTVRLGVFGSLSLGHRHLAAAVAGDERAQAVLYEAQPEIDLGAAGTAGGATPPDSQVPSDAKGSGVAPGTGAESARPERSPSAEPPLSPFRMGALRVLAAPAHLLFLVVLAFVGDRRGSVLRALATYGVAQAIALPIAILGNLHPSPALLGAAIALSIAYLGVENWLARDASRRWRIAFPFGLLHGFALAGGPSAVSLAAAPLPPALAGFTLGVEAVQLGIAVVLLSLAGALARRSRLERVGLRATSAAISTAALVWLVVEVAGR
jgi:hypothetical protein